MILTIVLFILTVSLIRSLLQTPMYKTSVTMYINRINYNIVPEVVNDSTSWMGYEAFFQTEYRLLKSKTLAKRVADRLNLTPGDLMPSKERVNYRPPSDPKVLDAQRGAVANSLLGMVDVTPIKNTFLVRNRVHKLRSETGDDSGECLGRRIHQFFP